MFASLCLLSCALIPGQTPAQPLPSLPRLSAPSPGQAPVARGSTWQLVPQLDRAQELVYRGQFHEEANDPQVQFSRDYRLELRVFVLETTPAGAEAAFLTILKSRDPRTAANQPPISETPASSARLEVLGIDHQGQLTSAAGVSLNAPLEGVPTLEVGAFVPVPRERLTQEQEWQVPEPNRPLRNWRLTGTEAIGGANCLKLVGVQESDDWNSPRGDRTAWRRQDTVWLPSRLGYAVRIERKIELRGAGRTQPTQSSVLRYDLESSLAYPGQLYESRQQEIAQARAFGEAAAPLLPAPQKYGQQLTVLLNKINHHLESQAPTPYREAVLQVKRRIEAAQHGETPAALATDPVPEIPSVASVGQSAPDWVVSQYTAPGSARLRDWQGRPIVMIFYNPNSPTGEDLLAYAQRLSDAHKGRVAVLLLTVVDKADVVLKQRQDLKVNLPVLSGSGLRISYEVTETPRLVVIDGHGIVRASFLGWGSETPAEVHEELKHWLPGEKPGGTPSPPTPAAPPSPPVSPLPLTPVSPVAPPSVVLPPLNSPGSGPRAAPPPLPASPGLDPLAAPPPIIGPQPSMHPPPNREKAIDWEPPAPGQ